MPARDFPSWIRGTLFESDGAQNLLSSLFDRQNIDLQQELTSVASGDEVMIFDVSETGQVKTKKATVANLLSGGTQPTRQIFTSGSGTYTTPAGCKFLSIREQAAGGGSGGSGTGSPGNGGAGGNSSFNSVVATGGNPSNGGSGTPGAAPSAGSGSASIRIAGMPGGPGFGAGATISFGGPGGGTILGHPVFTVGNATVAGVVGGTAGSSYGGGAGGPPGDLATYGAVGGASGGEYLELLITNPASSYSYAVGAGGSAGSAGTGGSAGSAGAPGIIIVDEYY